MDRELTKKYYKIKEVSEIINVPQSTLRFWEKEFSELEPKRSLTNRRYYTPADIELLQIIHYLLHVKGMKIEAVKEQLKNNKKNLSKRLEIISKLQAVRDDLTVLLESLSVRTKFQ